MAHLDETIIKYNDLDEDMIDLILENNIELEYHHAETYFDYDGKLYIIRNCNKSDIAKRLRERIIDDILKGG